MKHLDDALDELIAALSDAKAPLTDSLFKTKVIFHRMGKAELLPWVRYELEGYPTDNPDVQLPPYRIIPAVVRADILNGPTLMRNVAIPISHMKPETVKNMTTARIGLGIPALPTYVKSHSEAPGKMGMTSGIPPELFPKLQKGLAQGIFIQTAEVHTSMPEFIQIPYVVQSKLLDFVLDLNAQIIKVPEVSRASETELPQALKTAGINPTPAFQQIIYANTVQIGNQNTIQTQLDHEKAAVIKLLTEELHAKQEDVQQLLLAMEQDRKTGTVDVNNENTATGGWLKGFLKKTGSAVGGQVKDIFTDSLAKFAAEMVKLGGGG
jgi:hypothetical protein